MRVYICIYRRVSPIGRRRARPPIMEIRNTPGRDNLRHLDVVPRRDYLTVSPINVTGRFLRDVYPREDPVRSHYLVSLQ